MDTFCVLFQRQQQYTRTHLLATQQQQQQQAHRFTTLMSGPMAIGQHLFYLNKLYLVSKFLKLNLLF